MSARPAGYKYDVFLSYSRKGNVKEWVWNHFHPKLVKCLDDELPYDAEVFLDQSGIDPGEQWPGVIREALKRSCVIVTVWCPKYFQSDWCMTEWKTIRKRQEVIGATSPGLVYPIRYSDGEHYHQDAKLTQESRAFDDLTTPENVFSQTVEYTRFHKAVRDVATNLAQRILQVPPWDSNWPIVDHRGMPPAKESQPKFAASPNQSQP